MPAYNSATGCPVLYPGDSYAILNAEASTGITTSQQVSLALDNFAGSGETNCILEGYFSGDPGAFELDPQFAATDTDAAYIAPSIGGAITTTTGSPNWRWSYQYDPCLGPFVRIKKVTITNAVNVTVTVTR